MPEPAPRRILLGQGFLGSVRSLTGFKSSWSCTYDDLGSDNPFAALRAMEEGLAHDDVLVGYLGYECAQSLEPSLKLPRPPLDLPACWFGVFSGTADADPLASLDRLEAPLSIGDGDAPHLYRGKVEDIRRRIGAGDVFQVNVSHRQTAIFPHAEDRLIDKLPWQEALDAPFGALIDLGSFSVVSASPELFLELDDRRLATEPVKGTRPRSDDPVTDAALLAELQSDAKDRAENIMIADLMRNDLAKVCDDGSITEPVICGARSFSNVHHLFSRIEGRLKTGLRFADALAAAFPCGSVTGAPKIAAMDAIAALEGEGRGVYCGSLFAITGAGRARASVAIRTAMVDEGTRRVDVRSGGGVTTLSDPQQEYEETLDKAYLFRQMVGADDPRSR
ncbi:MAG: anthranilate synthase component I family protein [Pseudomonadota bacterium]